jgi:hypothetical protein
LEIWDLLRGTRRATIARQAWQLAVSSRNQLAAAGYDLYLIDLEHGLLQHEIATGSRTFLIGFDAAGEHLASALEDRTLRVFDARTGAALATFTGLDEVRELETLTFAPDGKSLDLTGPTKAVHADLVGGLLSRPPFQAPSGQPKGPGGQPFHCDLRPLGEGLEPAALAISNDCSTAAIGSPQGPIVLLRPSAATSPLLFDVAAAGEAAFVQVPLRGPSSRPLERILNEEWPGLPAASIEPLGPDARALLVCRVGPKVLPLEVCEERLITQGALRAFFGRH